MDEALAAEFAALGVARGSPPPAAAGEEEIEVWDVNADAVHVFLALATQWRVAIGRGGAVWLGLDLAAAEVVMRQLGLWHVDLADLRAMEAAALPILNERRD